MQVVREKNKRNVKNKQYEELKKWVLIWDKTINA